MPNYSFKQPPDVPDGSVIEGFNLVQGIPHTKIYEGKTGLTFRNCNLTNCDVPIDSVVESCLRVQVSFCSHNFPSWLENGYIPECVRDCIHKTIVDTVTVDGVVVDTNYTYEDKAVE